VKPPTPLDREIFQLRRNIRREAGVVALVWGRG